LLTGTSLQKQRETKKNVTGEKSKSAKAEQGVDTSEKTFSPANDFLNNERGKEKDR